MLDWTAYVIFIVVIGGVGTIEGPIVGVIVFYLLQQIAGTDHLMAVGDEFLGEREADKPRGAGDEYTHV